MSAHAAFYYLSKRYGLEQFAVTGVSPESEPDPGRVADLSDRIRRDGVTTVFYEELVPRDFADTLARETGARVDVLSPIEGLTKKEIQAGDSYLTVMRRNLAAGPRPSTARRTRLLACSASCAPSSSQWPS